MEQNNGGDQGEIIAVSCLGRYIIITTAWYVYVCMIACTCVRVYEYAAMCIIQNISGTPTPN